MRRYIVELPDGHKCAFTAKLLAENMYTQCFFDSNQHLLFKAIVNHSFIECCKE
jgi:hypothetical protein